MWLYAAAGSGVSINVGRTRVLPSYEALGRLLNRCQFWRSPSAGPECDARRVPHDDLDTRTPTHDCPDLENVDSVQVLAHYEYFSREPRHEIVMLRLDNCGRLRPHTPGVMCGREPHLCHRLPCGWEYLQLPQLTPGAFDPFIPAAKSEKNRKSSLKNERKLRN